MYSGKFLLFFIFLWAFITSAKAQRDYAESSVLTSGEWYKIKTTASGVYIIDKDLMQKLGAGNSSLENIRLYGNHGKMLNEDPASPFLYGLKEIPLAEISTPLGLAKCFYAPGVIEFNFNQPERKLIAKKNLYSDTAVYFLQVNSTTAGKKPELLAEETGQPASDINYYHWRYYHETDSFNLLNSGKEWFGEDMGFLPGKPLSLNFTPAANAEFIPGTGFFQARMIARSFSIPARISATINDDDFSQIITVPPVSTGPYDVFARDVEVISDFSASGIKPSLIFNFIEGSGNSQSWLDYFSIVLPARLKLTSQQMLFRNLDLTGSLYRFNIEDAAAETQIWNVTDPFLPKILRVSQSGGNLRFLAKAGAGDEFLAFNSSNLLKPIPAGKLANQNLLQPSTAEYLIITASALEPAAERLAKFHRDRGLTVKLIKVEEIFNEFSSGLPDPVAIRDYVKMHYDRAEGDSLKLPKYLLLLGKGSFDPKNRIRGNINFLPAWQSANSLDPLSTYVSDDFYGFLDDEDDINSAIPPLLDIGIGRIPAASLRQANEIIDKIISYHQPSSLGSWKLNMSFIADDEDLNLHLEDAESISSAVEEDYPQTMIEKFYLDAFEQESSPAGQRYPQVRQEILNNLFKGVLIWNYTGHGGNQRLAEETIFDKDLLKELKNSTKLPLFIVATCDFTPFDNPFTVSLGEELLYKPSAGAIALMSATRLVFAASNHLIHKNYLEILLKNNADKTLGDAAREAKNLNYSVFGDVLNNRKFLLFGDPAMKLAFPQHQVRTTSINEKAPGEDSLKAMQRVIIKGEIIDNNGNILNDFTGTVFPVVLDKPVDVSTRGNDPGSRVQSFKIQQRKLFNGSATVKNGKFSFEFVIPKDIQYQYGKGKILYYAENGNSDASGVFDEIIIGGTGGNIDDKQGPEIKLFLNDEHFVSGGIVNSTPVLLADIKDESGINISGTGPGHNLTAVLDDGEEFILNGYYVSEKDDFTKGKIRYQLPALEPGLHSIKLTAWDGVNNAGTAMLDFKVVGDENLVLKNVLNYPNPFTTSTCFWFDHNRPGEELTVQIQIFTISGKLIRTLKNTIFSTGNRSKEIFWDGRDDFGQKLGRGVYIYSITVQTGDGKLARKMERLYLL